MSGSYEIEIEQGSTFTLELLWKDPSNTPIDLTGWTASMHCRAHISSTTPFLTLTTENGYITLGGTAGTITLSVPAPIIAAITDTGGVYDLLLTSSGGVVTKLLSGNVKIIKGATR